MFLQDPHGNIGPNVTELRSITALRHRAFGSPSESMPSTNEAGLDLIGWENLSTGQTQCALVSKGYGRVISIKGNALRTNEKYQLR